MNTHFQWWPDQASSFAGKVDGLFLFLIGITTFFTVLIFVMILYLGLKYRRRPGVKPVPVKTSKTLEATWTIIPFIITMVIFFWGAGLFIHIERPPADAMQIDVVGKQWMWKLQHPQGRREINELHIPLGRPVRLNMTSQDVIHSFFIPAFRVKQDVVPGRYSTEWFKATKLGEYHLFCAEYCGADHSRMIGRVIVMTPSDYQAWLAGSVPEFSPAQAGEKLFQQYACITCHGQRGPGLAALYGSRVKISDGTTVIADENYLRESILNPSAKIVAGFAPLMPTFAGQLTEEQVMQLISYIKSLKEGVPTQGIPAAGATPQTTSPAMKGPTQGSK
jgi:cytochrome c oxidase subunit 2